MSVLEASRSGTVLVLDGDSRRASGRADHLRLDGWQAMAITRESAARELLAGVAVAVLGDLEGSGAASLRLLREVRSGRLAEVDTGLRAIAFADAEPEMLSAYAAGADLTLSRSATSTLLSASVAALARRRWRADAVVRLGRLEVDRGARTAQVDGQAVRLTRREFDVLDAMAQAPGRVFTREELSREVWGTRHLPGSRTIDTTVHRMATKLRGAGAERALVQNVWGQGYKLTEGAER